jgi:hypothetical protein
VFRKKSVAAYKIVIEIKDAGADSVAAVLIIINLSWVVRVIVMIGKELPCFVVINVDGFDVERPVGPDVGKLDGMLEGCKDGQVLG